MQAARAVAACVVVLTAASARAAEPAELTLTWQAPDACPTPAEVEHQFVRLLGGASRAASGKHITATAAVRTTSSTRWVLDLSTALEGATGKRTLSGDSCSSVASAAALILALMIDPAAAERAFESEPPPPPPPPPKPAPAPTVTAPPPPPPTPLQLHVRALAGVMLLLPYTPYGGVGVGARHGHLFVDVSGLASLEHHAEAATPPATNGGDFRLLAGGARACLATDLMWKGSFLNTCLGGGFERLTGTGFGLPSPAPTGATMLAGTLSLLGFYSIAGPVALVTDVGGAVRTYHPTFTLTQQNDAVSRVFEVPRVSVWVALGLAVSL